MTIPQQALELIKEFEGLRLKAYRCPAGVPTIGYGTTRINGKPVTMDMVITKARAEELLEDYCKVLASELAKLIWVPLNDNQFSALISFVYNIGVSAFKTSTMRRRLNSRRYQDAAEQFEKWVYAGKTKLDGLVRRREAEKELFLEEV